MALQNLTQPTYHQWPSNSSGGLQGLSNMVHGFLGTVQPNSFPEDLLTRLLKRDISIQDQAVYTEILKYETGFLVCTAIGLLFIFLVPLLGLYFCCCRCCGNCGGFMYQKQKKHMACKRQTLFLSLLGVTALLLAGDICAYASNYRISQGVGRSFDIFNDMMSNLNIYLDSVPQEINFIIGSSSVPVNQINDSLLNIGTTLGNKIKRQLSGPADTALTAAEQLLREIGIVEEELQKVNQTGSHLQELKRELDKNLTHLRTEINNTLNHCDKPCRGVSVDSLKTGSNFDAIPDVSHPLQLLSDLINSDPNSTIIKARDALDEIPQKVSNQTQKEVSEIQDQLHLVKREINALRGNFSMLDSLKNISVFTEDASKMASEYNPDIVRYDRYRWAVGVCLCCVVLLIIVLNVFGLMLGGFGLDPHRMPSKRGCLSNSGGNFFMASVGFSFIFSWLLMLLVLILFLVGGNSYTLICQPWASGILLQFLDTPGLFPQFNLSELMHLKVSDINIASIYKNCEENTPLWSTFHLDDIISLDDILNISKYTRDIDSTLKKINVSLSSITLLDDEQKRRFLKLSAKDGPLDVDFASALEQLNQNLTNQDLNIIALKLDKLAAEKLVNKTTRKDLENQATQLRNLQHDINLSFPPEIEVLKRSIKNLQHSLSPIPEMINFTLTATDKAQSLVKNRTKEIIKNETKDFVHSMLSYFESYLDWAKGTIQGEVGRCGPAAWVLDGVNTIVCNYIVDSLNAFWFSLAWCTVFLLPSIILAVRLAKFYRRMSIDDIYEDETMESLELSRQSMFKMPRAELRK